MSKNNNAHPIKSPADDNKNKQYVFRDAVGKAHIYKAGEAGMTSKWIYRVRHGENVLRSANFHYYNKWNGKEYVRYLLRMDDMSADKLEHYPSMPFAKDPLSILIEKEDRENFDQRFIAAMTALTDAQWRLVYKRNELQMSDAEIAEEEGVTQAAISRRWDRIQEKINRFFT